MKNILQILMSLLYILIVSCVVGYKSIIIDSENNAFWKKYILNEDEKTYALIFSGSEQSIPEYYFSDNLKIGQENYLFIYIGCDKKQIDDFPIQPGQKINGVESANVTDESYIYKLGVYETIKVYFVDDIVSEIRLKYFTG